MIGADWIMRGTLSSLEGRLGTSIPSRECWFKWDEKGWALLEQQRPGSVLLSVWSCYDPRSELRRVLALLDETVCSQLGCDREMDHDGLHESATLGIEMELVEKREGCNYCDATVGDTGTAFFFEELTHDKIICGKCLVARNG